MKRLLQYGLTDCWGSFMPIVMWFLMGLLCGWYFVYDGLDLGVLLLLFCLEMPMFLPSVVKYCFSSHIMVYHPVIWVSVINFAGYCLRFLSQWLLSGYYFSVSAAVAISTPVSIVLVAVLYAWFRRKYWAG